MPPHLPKRHPNPAIHAANLRAHLAALTAQRDSFLLDTAAPITVTTSSAVHSYTPSQAPLLTRPAVVVSASTAPHTLTPHQAPLACLPPPTTATATATAGSCVAASRTRFASVADADAVVKRHIALLHAYNEIRDVGMGLLGLVTEGRGCRVVDVMEEFGAGVED